MIPVVISQIRDKGRKDMIKDKPCVIFDIDGTLADCTYRRSLALKTGVMDWKTFLDPKVVANDSIIESVAWLYKNMFFRRAKDIDIYLVTGRGEDLREVTSQWLSKKSLYGYKEMFMRPKEDFRPDTDIKKEIYQTHFKDKKVLMVFDDRDRLVSMWRGLGLACLQVAEGDF